jgi:hypothetical protein
MAATLGKRISRAVTNALRARDRAEMRAIDALLSLVESPRKNSKRPKTQSQKRPRARAHRIAPRGRGDLAKRVARGRV